MQQKLLKEYIQIILEQEEVVIDDKEKQITWRQLKKMLNYFIGIKKGKKVIKGVAGFIPFIGGARDLTEVLKGLMDIPDSKRSSHFLYKFDLDDYISKIVDNNIEEDFIKYLVKQINEKEDLDIEVKNFNMNDLLKDYLNKKYNGRTITGF